MKKSYFSLYDISVLSLLGALTFVLQTVLRLPLQIPGHAGIYLVVPIIVGVGILEKPGSATYIGLIFGLLSAFFGSSNADVFSFFRYFAMGLTIDLVSLAFRNHLNVLLVGFIIGASGNLAKMVVNYYIDTTLGIPAAFIVIGLGLTSLFHLAFGGIGGIVAAATLDGLYKAGVIKKHDPAPD
jgi:hypothetical protein